MNDSHDSLGGSGGDSPTTLQPRSFRRHAPRRAASVALCDVWLDLILGRTVILHTFETRTHCYLILRSRPRDEAVRSQLAARDRAMLWGWLTGTSQKCLGHQHQRSVSSLAGGLKRALAAMGLRCTANRAPMLLIMAANAAGEDARFASVRARSRTGAAETRLIVSAPHPQKELGRGLSVAEREVARLLLAGRNHAEIAEFRRSRPRTVANQLASAFRKEKVSGRVQLAVQLVRRQREGTRVVDHRRAAWGSPESPQTRAGLYSP